MFDYFLEVSDTLSQGVTVLNYFLDFLGNTVNNLLNAPYYQDFLGAISEALPSEISVGIVMPLLSIMVFDFIRGR